MAVLDTTRRTLRSAEASAARAETASPVYFMLHMPRTGGNTIAAHLKAHLGDQVCAALRPAPLEMLGECRFRLDEGSDFRQVHAVTGHYLGRSLERRFPGREIRRTLLLRDPVGFHVSYYNHRMMFSLSRGGPTCDFERHLRVQPRDLVPLLLLWYWLEMPLRTFLTTGDARKYELLNEALSGFWFVGSYEDGDRLLAAVARDLGIPTDCAAKKHDGGMAASGSRGGRSASKTSPTRPARRSWRRTRSMMRSGMAGERRGSTPPAAVPPAVASWWPPTGSGCAISSAR